MLEYRENPPPPRLAQTIECFWTMKQEGPDGLHRVVPDGCADILFTRNGGRFTLEAVGPMTGYRDFRVPVGQLLVGARFHPGMWSSFLRVPGDRVTDRVVPLEDLWGSRAKELLNHLSAASSAEECSRLIEAAMPSIGSPDRVQRALGWLTHRQGLVSLDELAAQAGYSMRQFRRLCLEQTGLTPKFLARIVRFRHALSRIHVRPRQFAEFALDCGYYDQAHFINEFRELSGRTPSVYADGRFFQSSDAG
jgi:AraC-like DNA-binding protein